MWEGVGQAEEELSERRRGRVAVVRESDFFHCCIHGAKGSFLQ